MTADRRTVKLINRFSFVLVLLLLLSLRLAGQNLVRGIVTDSVTKEAIPFCSFIVKGTQKGGITDENGQFSVLVSEYPATLVFSRIGYSTKQVTANADGKNLQVRMSPTAFLMKPVTITTEKVITWHPDDAWAFMDFAFYDDYIVSLVAVQGKREKYLVLMDTLGITVAQLKIKYNADSLYTDCLGAVHLFAGDSCFQVYYDYNKLSLPYASAANEFRQSMLPCRCQLGPYYYFSYLTYQRQKLEYYWINWYEKGKYIHFLSIQDSVKINSFNENYDIRYFLAERRKSKGYEEPVDSIKKYIDFYRSQLALDPLESNWLSPVSEALVQTGSRVFIVNAIDSTLLTYAGPGELKDSVFFECMRMKGWQKDELYGDGITGAVYGRIVNAQGCSVFVRIDPATGKETGRVTVERFPFMVRPKIRGGCAYFLWKDPFSEQPVKLRIVSLQ